MSPSVIAEVPLLHNTVDRERNNVKSLCDTVDNNSTILAVHKVPMLEENCRCTVISHKILITNKLKPFLFTYTYRSCEFVVFSYIILRLLVFNA